MSQGRNRNTSLESPSLTGRALTGLAWSSSGAGVHAVMQVAVLSVLARLVTPAEFGVVAAAQVVVSFAAIFQQVGVGPALVQRAALTDQHQRVAFTFTCALGIALTLVMWISAPAVAGFFRLDTLPSVLRAISSLFVLQSVAVVAGSLLQRDLAFRRLAGIDVVSYGVGYGVVGTVAAGFGLGVWALVSAALAQAALKSGLLLTSRRHPMRPSLDRRAAVELLRFGSGFTLGRVFNQLALQGDNLVVGRWLGPTALGMYGRAYQLMATPATVTGTAIDKVLFPAMAQVQDDAAKLGRAYARGVGIVALVMVPASVFVFVMAPEIVTVLLGTQWGDVVAPLRIFALGMMLRTGYKLSDSLARAKGAVFRRAWRQAAYAAGVLVGAWIGQGAGVPGVAVGVLAALLLNYVLMAHLGLRLTGLPLTSFLAAHARAVPLAVVTLAATEVARLLTRHAGLADWSTLVVVIVFVTSVCAVALVSLPRLFLGIDGRWLLSVAWRQLPAGLVHRFAGARTR